MFPCPLCKSRYPNEGFRRRHYNDELIHRPKDLTCKSCRSSHATLQLYYTHMTSEHPDKFCIFCCKEYKSFKGLQQHERMQEVHPRRALNIEDMSNPPDLNTIVLPSNSINDSTSGNNNSERNDTNTTGRESETTNSTISGVESVDRGQSNTRQVTYNLRSQTTQRSRVIEQHRQVAGRHPGLNTIVDANEAIDTSTEGDREYPRASVARSEIPRIESDRNAGVTTSTTEEYVHSAEREQITTTKSGWWSSFVRLPRLSLPYVSQSSTGHANSASQAPPVDETSTSPAPGPDITTTSDSNLTQTNDEADRSNRNDDSSTPMQVETEASTSGGGGVSLAPMSTGQETTDSDENSHSPPTTVPTTSNLNNSSLETLGSTKCRICSEQESVISALKCGHVFGTGCIEEQLRNEPGSGCPICRGPIAPSDLRRLFLSA